MILDRAVRLEEQAKARWQATTVLLEDCKQATATAHKKTQLEMGNKIADTEILRQELNKQRKSTDAKIVEAKRVLGLTSQKLASMGKPITANSERTRIRDTRTPREAFADEVTEALDLQRSRLEGNKVAL